MTPDPERLEHVSFDVEGAHVEGFLDHDAGFGELWIIDDRGVVLQRDYLRLPEPEPDDDAGPEVERS
jgi:hypothetical protein